MKIGNLVEYQNDIWEIIYIEPPVDGGMYMLSCNTTSNAGSTTKGPL